MILMAFRHGLRASELCSLRWDQADLVYGRLHVNRLKNGIASVHPLTGIELRALRRLQREQKPGRYIFVSERGAPMSAVAFRRMVTRLGPAAMMPFPIHPHMLRHSTGFKLANQGVDTRSLQHYLGYKNIQHTVDIASFLPSGSEISGRTRERLADESILGAWMVDLKDQGLSETAMNDGVAKEVADEEARC
jgi:integrase